MHAMGRSVRESLLLSGGGLFCMRVTEVFEDRFCFRSKGPVHGWRFEVIPMPEVFVRLSVSSAKSSEVSGERTRESQTFHDFVRTRCVAQQGARANAHSCHAACNGNGDRNEAMDL
jgi:hypothetical protein